MYVFVCMHACIHVYVCMYVCTYVGRYVCMYAWHFENFEVTQVFSVISNERTLDKLFHTCTYPPRSLMCMVGTTFCPLPKHNR